MLEVDRESVTPDGRIEGFIDEVELETKLFAVISDRSLQIIDEKLRSDPGNVCFAANCYGSHLIPPVTLRPSSLQLGSSGA